MQETGGVNCSFEALGRKKEVKGQVEIELLGGSFQGACKSCSGCDHSGRVHVGTSGVCGTKSYTIY